MKPHKQAPEIDSTTNHAREGSFNLEPHVCRTCFGRIVNYLGGSGSVYVCTNCGLSAHGDDASCVCACGIKLKRQKIVDGRPVAAHADAGIRCHENPNPTPDFPSVFVASYQAEGC